MSKGKTMIELKHNFILGLSLLLLNCGDDKKSESSPPPTVIYGKLVMENAKQAFVNKEYSLTSAKCTFDSKTAILDMNFSGSNAKLQMSIRNYNKAANSEFSCSQNVENKKGDIANGTFDTCGILASLPYQESEKASTFAMYRHQTNIGEIAYGGACKIKTSFNTTTKKVSGTISCTKLIRTVIAETPDPSVNKDDTADIATTSSFECAI